MLNKNVSPTVTIDGPTICKSKYEMTMAIKECAKHQPWKKNIVNMTAYQYCT